MEATFLFFLVSAAFVYRFDHTLDKKKNSCSLSPLIQITHSVYSLITMRGYPGPLLARLSGKMSHSYWLALYHPYGATLL